MHARLEQLVNVIHTDIVPCFVFLNYKRIANKILSTNFNVLQKTPET